MSTKSKNLDKNRKSHDRSALMQWTAIGLFVALGLLTILLFTETNGSGGHGGLISLLPL